MTLLHPLQGPGGVPRVKPEVDGDSTLHIWVPHMRGDVSGEDSVWSAATTPALGYRFIDGALDETELTSL